MVNIVKQTTEVYCTVVVEGTHHWPACPFEEVAYLRDVHRHLFHIKAFAKVNHSDRSIEFILLKHKITQYLLDKYSNNGPQSGCFGVNVCVFGAMSCEMIAEDLILQFNLSRCDVNEDGENGAIVTVEPV